VGARDGTTALSGEVRARESQPVWRWVGAAERMMVGGRGLEGGRGKELRSRFQQQEGSIISLGYGARANGEGEKRERGRERGGGRAREEETAPQSAVGCSVATWSPGRPGSATEAGARTRPCMMMGRISDPACRGAMGCRLVTGSARPQPCCRASGRRCFRTRPPPPTARQCRSGCRVIALCCAGGGAGGGRLPVSLVALARAAGRISDGIFR
jgi:hypothetical protein